MPVPGVYTGKLVCEHPRVLSTSGGLPVACGKCHLCLVGKKLEWCSRAKLEAAQSLVSSFVTLTYAPEHLPADGCVSRAHVRAWRDRLRISLRRELGLRSREWGIAEYGEKNGRPHVHAILFGVEPEAVRELVQRSWPHGAVQVARLRDGGVDYVGAYCVKGMFRRDDARLQGREPEFMFWPSKPPLGAALADAVALTQSKYLMREQLLARGAEPLSVVRTEGKLKLLGRTLRLRMRKQLGLDAYDAKVVRSVALEVRLEQAKARFEGDWSDGKAHVDAGRVARRVGREQLFRASKAKRSL